MPRQRLRTPAWVSIVFGLLIGIAALPALAAPLMLMTDAVFWPIDGQPAALTQPAQLLAAICGGLMAGWGLMMLLLAEGRPLRQAVFFGGLGWFLVDSLGSVAAGVPLNAAFNLGFLAIFLFAVRPVRPASSMVVGNS